MKRFPPFIATALLLLCIGCVGCRRGDSSDLVLLTTGGPMREAVEEAVAEFQTEHPNVRVQIVTTPGADYYKKSLTMLAGRAHVDILWLGQGFGMFAGRGALLDLQPFIDNDPDFRLEDYNQRVLDWYRYDGKLYGIPYGVALLVIAYNMDLFDQAGVPYPEPDWTLEDMIEMARGLTRSRSEASRDQVVGLGFFDLDYRYYGLSLLTEDETRFGLNTDTGRRWLERNLELLYEDRILRRGSDIESLDSLTGFLNQQVAITNLPTWSIHDLHVRAPFRWDVAVIPTGYGGGRNGWASSNGFSIARTSKNPELAWELLKKLSGPDFQRKLLTTSIPTLETLHQEYLEANPAPPADLVEVLRMLDSMEPNPRVTAFPEIEAEWNYWKDRVFLRQVTVEEALGEAESNINRILDLHHQETEP